jgi:ABC-2 type transport system permease protein
MKSLTIADKNLRLFFRDRMGLFWTFAFPLLLIMVFSLAFSSRSSVRINILTVQQDNGQLANTYISIMENVFNVEKLENVAEAEARVLDGKDVGVLIVPSGFSAGAENARFVYDETRGELATTAVQIVEGITQQFFGMGAPITTESVRGGYKEWNAAQQYVPGMGIMMILMVGGIGASTRIVLERKTGTFKRNLLTPISKLSFLGGELLSGFVIGCMQTIVFFGIGILVFGMPVAGSYLLLALISAIVIVFGVGLGLLISTFARSPDAASGAVQAFIFPAAALGGLWFPIEIMPGFMQSVARIFPTTHAMNAFQDVIVRGKGLLDIAPSLAVVAGFALFFLILGSLLFKWKE